MIETLVSFAVASFILALSPGPDNIFVLAQSLAHGSRSGIAVTSGLVSGCIVHTTLLAFGVSAVISNSVTGFYLLKLVGAGYLLYLAFRVFRSDATIAVSETNSPKKSFWQLFKIGLVMNLVNPKVLIFFLALFPGFLWNTHENTVLQFYVLGGLFMVVSFVVFSSIAVLSGKISHLIKKRKDVSVALKWLQSVVFVGIAAYIIFT